ncbi:MAG: capsular biosynthesis protein [Bacteroidetes bacterium]|nr:capsular biosynthesis protein [Bacteroidota bacterium]
MKVIIPMTGQGSRFIKAGYTTYKALIEMHGKPIIEYVASLFPTETNFIFICRNDMLQDSELNLEATLLNIIPTANIVGINEHKLGPVYTVAQIFDLIEDEEPVVCNYCDFFMNWDYTDFKQKILNHQYAGAIPCYTGFHPHLLHLNNLYAGCQVDSNMNLKEIKEKFSFEADKSLGYHSAGTYYFDKGKYVKKYFQQLMDEQITLNGEYYISLVYNLMLKDKMDILVYDKIPHFCQLGTPEDMMEYNNWSNIFEAYSK